MAVEQLFSQDTWLFSQDTAEATVSYQAVSGPFSVLAQVDYVFGQGAYAGVFLASAATAGQRNFVAVVCGEDGKVKGFFGTLGVTGSGFTVSSASPVDILNGDLASFPTQISYSASQWHFTYSGGQTYSFTDVALTVTPAIGGIILFRTGSDEVATAKFTTYRHLSSSITFPGQPVGTSDVTGLVDDGALATLTEQAEPHTHAIVGAYLADLEVDVGKSVPWVHFFTDDVFIADINNGDPRYWVIDWDKSFRDSKFISLGVDYFTDPVGWRQAQFAAADAAWNYGDDDWVLFVDACEGLNCDTRSLPDDVVINPFSSYIHRETTRAEGLGKTAVSIPWYAFIRNGQPMNQTWQLLDPVDVQDSLNNSGSTLSVEDVNTALVDVAVPYYYQEESFTKRGLTRLIKVSTLRNPGFNWASIDTLGTPDDNVKLSIISYAYAKWTNPATMEEDGLKIRSKMSQVRPLTGLPTNGSDVAGTAGPYQVSTGDGFTDVAGAAEWTDSLRTPMYSGLFRISPQDGVWYDVGGLAPPRLTREAIVVGEAYEALVTSTAGNRTKILAGSAAATSAMQAAYAAPNASADSATGTTDAYTPPALLSGQPSSAIPAGAVGQANPAGVFTS